MYYYQLYGLKVQSNIEFVQLYSVEPFPLEAADMDIWVEKSDELSKPFEKIKAAGKYFDITDHGIWFDNQAGHFLVETQNGKTIMKCIKYSDITYDEAKAFLLGNCLAIAMTQRKKLAIHGSTLLVGEKAIIVCGGSGSGKSTTAMGVIDKGAGLLADDISVIDIVSESGKAIAYPGFPEQKLCRDAALERGLELDSLRYIDEDKDKFALDRDSIFVKEKKEVSDIFIISKSNGSAVEIEEVSGEDSINAVIDNLFLRDLYNGVFSLEPTYALKCIKLAAQVRIHRISRPRDKDTRKEIVDIIFDELAR